MSMRFLPLRRLAWQSRLAAGAAGWPGAAALLVIASSAAFALLVLKPIDDRIADARTLVARMRMSGVEKIPRLPPVADSAEQLRQFYLFFPSGASLPDWMEKLYGIAASQNIALDQGQYHLSRDRLGKIQQYEIVLPLRGSYLQIRGFLAQALQELPHLALQSITFDRQKVGDPKLEAQVRLTLYLAEK